jgi:hypothetical protein
VQQGHEWYPCRRAPAGRGPLDRDAMNSVAVDGAALMGRGVRAARRADQPNANSVRPGPAAMVRRQHSVAGSVRERLA